MDDYYERLGIQHDADDAKIKHAYRTLAKQFHPDARAQGNGKITQFYRVQEAYDILINPQQRRKYDDGLLRQSKVLVTVGFNSQAVFSSSQMTYGGTTMANCDVTEISWWIRTPAFVRSLPERELTIKLVSQANGVPTELVLRWSPKDLRDATVAEWCSFGGELESLLPNDPLYPQLYALMYKKHGEKFQEAVNSIFAHAAAYPITRILETLSIGKKVALGPITLSQAGIEFKTGVLCFKTIAQIPWTSCDFMDLDDEILVSHKTDINKSVSISKKIGNAVLLPTICKWLCRPTP